MKGLLFAEESRGVVAGLTWHQIHDYPKSVSRDVALHAKRYGADRVIVQATDNGAGVVGCFLMRESETKPPKELHSLAALLLRVRGDDNMVLVWRYGNNKTAVVVIQGGLPVLDELFSNNDAAGQTVSAALRGEFGFSGHTLISNDRIAYQSADSISEEDLISQCSKDTRLGRVPVNKGLLLSALVFFVLVAGGSMYAMQIKKEAEERARMAEIAKQDPVPGYQEALAANIGRMGYTRQSMLNLIKRVGQYPIWQDGWLLRQIECQADTCVATWDRKGGTTNGLLALRAGEVRVRKSGDKGSGDEEATTFKSQLEPFGLTAQTEAVTLEKGVLVLENMYQKWRNAKLNISEPGTQFVTWPNPPSGDPSLLPPDMTLKSRKVAIEMIPGPLAEEVAERAPATLYWDGLLMQVSLSDKEKLIIYSLRGNNYVR